MASKIGLTREQLFSAGYSETKELLKGLYSELLFTEPFNGDKFKMYILGMFSFIITTMLKTGCNETYLHDMINTLATQVSKEMENE